MAASTTIVRAGDKSHKFSWDLINQANPSHSVLVVLKTVKFHLLKELCFFRCFFVHIWHIIGLAYNRSS